MRRTAVVVATLALLAACKSSTLPNDPRQMPEVLPSRASPEASGAGYVAQLKGIGGSSAQGTVNAAERDGTMVVRINLQNVPPGMYSWALHERGNCTSSNGFSAGAPWAPPGAKKAPVDLLPDFVYTDGQAAFVTARVRGARIDGSGGLAGRSVLVYQGGGIQPIRPDVPSNVVACGVFEPARTLF